jgi:hypothetical protein
MQLLNNRLFIKFLSGGALKENYDIGDGQKIYIDPSFNPEQHSSVLAKVEESGIEGIEKDDIVAVSYQVAFRYKVVGETRIYENEITLPDGREVFDVPYALVIAVKKEDGYKAIGEYCLLKEKAIAEAKTESGLILPTLAVEAESKWCEAEFLSGDLDAVKGEIVMFEKPYRSEYEFDWNEKYLVIPKSYILLKKTEDAEANITD